MRKLYPSLDSNGVSFGGGYRLHLGSRRYCLELRVLFWYLVAAMMKHKLEKTWVYYTACLLRTIGILSIDLVNKLVASKISRIHLPP